MSLYKCIVLDLDNTLWPGILADEGIDGIIKNICDDSINAPFRAFQEHLATIAEKGVYIALCTHNDGEMVRKILGRLSVDTFPIIDHIVAIVADYNPKSEGIRRIANELNILLTSIIFVDDSLLNREEVCENVDDVYVFDFPRNVNELATDFRNMEFRFNEQTQGMSRRERKVILDGVKANSTFPEMDAIINKISTADDSIKNRVFIQLLECTNQFNWSKKSSFCDGANVFYVKLFLRDGRELDIVSAFAITIESDRFFVENWAVSCGFFDIGLEDYIFGEMITMAEKYECKEIAFSYIEREENSRCKEFAMKYNLNTNEDDSVLFTDDLPDLKEAVKCNHNICTLDNKELSQ